MVLMSSDLDFVPGRWDPDLGSDVLGPGHPKPGCPEAGCLFAGSAVWDFGVCLSVPQLYLVLEMLKFSVKCQHCLVLTFMVQNKTFEKNGNIVLAGK